MLAADIRHIKQGAFTLAQWTQAPRQLEKVTQLHWPLDCVFDLLANHQKWPRIFPWLQQVTIDNTHALIKDGLGAKRTCDMGNRMVLEEVIIGWQPPQMYAYAALDETNPFGMSQHVSLIQCHTIANRTTRLHWQHYFDHANPVAMRQQLDSSLNAAVKSLIACCGGQLEKTLFYRG